MPSSRRRWRPARSGDAISTVTSPTPPRARATKYAMVSSVTWPSACASRVVIGGMTMRLRISTDPIRAGVSSTFIGISGRAHFAAIHRNRRAVQPAAVRRRHEGDQAGDILDRAEPRDTELGLEL